MSSKHLNSHFFCKTILVSRNFYQESVRANFRNNHHNTVWKLWNFSLTVFWKNFVKVIVLLTKLLNSWFDESFFSGSEFFIFPQSEQLDSMNFRKNFVKAMVWFYQKITKSLIWRIYFSEREFLVFPHCVNITQWLSGNYGNSL